MRYHSQNLTADYLDRKERSLFWAGRAWLGEIHWQWSLGPYAGDFAGWISFGYGEAGRGICLHACIPLLFSIYLVFETLGPACRECKSGVAIHNGALWLYPLVDEMESRSDWPWWKKNFAWYFPWTFDWFKTEILSHDFKPVWTEVRGKRRDYDERKKAELSVEKSYPYNYTLRSGEKQTRTAAIHVTRMEWRARWWPLIPRKQIRTSIDITFNDEVGEGTGSWKGGCTGCGYEMLPSETPEQTLRRMESERLFKR